MRKSVLLVLPLLPRFQHVRARGVLGEPGERRKRSGAASQTDSGETHTFCIAQVYILSFRDAALAFFLFPPPDSTPK